MSASHTDKHTPCACGHGHEHHRNDSCTCGHNPGHFHGYDHNHSHKPARPAHRGQFIKRVYLLENLGCANCAAKMEAQIAALEGVAEASITFATKQLRIRAKDPDALLPRIREI